MRRGDVIEKLESLYDQADKNNIGLNETELEYKELVADEICKLNNEINEREGVINKALSLLRKLSEESMCSVTADEEIFEFLNKHEC